MPDDKCIISGIVKHKDGMMGFRVSFNTPELAQKYKEMVKWYIESDKIRTTVKRGIYDNQ